MSLAEADSRATSASAKKETLLLDCGGAGAGAGVK
jgi:hypothetical protein